MDKKGTKEMEKAVNRLTLIVIAIIDMFFFAGYISDFKQGNISFAFMMAVEVTVFLTLLCGKRGQKGQNVKQKQNKKKETRHGKVFQAGRMQKKKWE